MRIAFSVNTKPCVLDCYSIVICVHPLRKRNVRLACPRTLKVRVRATLVDILGDDVLMPKDCDRLGVESGYGAHTVVVVRGDQDLIEDAVELSLAAGEPRACFFVAEQPFKHTTRERSIAVEVCAHNHQHCRCAIEPCPELWVAFVK